MPENETRGFLYRAGFGCPGCPVGSGAILINEAPERFRRVCIRAGCLDPGGTELLTRRPAWHFGRVMGIA